MADTAKWYSLSVEKTLEKLETRPNGLTANEVQSRRALYGVNELETEMGTTAWKILRAQFNNVLIIILLIATTISAFLGHAVEAIAITVIVLFAVILGFIQEYRADRALKAIRQMAAPTAKVLRDAVETVVPARDLVPGDIILLTAGDRVAADARVIDAKNLRADESALTGESTSVSKQTKALDVPQAIGDRNNMVLSGTDITYGRGQAVVVKTGMDTEFGKITDLLKSVETSRTPLQKNLDRVGHILGIVAGVLVMIIVALGLLRGMPILDMLIFGIALAVAVVPEALPAVVTISLAIGMQRMVRRNTLVNRLPAVETLGSTSVICSDKTGTLTKNEMTVRELWADGQVVEVTGSGYDPSGELVIKGEADQSMALITELLEGATLCSDANLVQTENHWEAKGDPTEGALMVAAAKAGINKPELERRLPRIDEIPFTSESKRMVTLHRANNTTIAYMKGAPEVVLAACNRYLSSAGEMLLTSTDKKRIEDAALSMAQRALRVLGLAVKRETTLQDADQNLVFLGLAGMIDPARPEAAVSIATCRSAGIKPIMITGDHPQTAIAIAKELGLLKDGEMVTGEQLDSISDRELSARIHNIEVYARVSPEHKLRVVDLWKANHQIVAMTGDGVNDAPALKRADIGIAMGITGTDVSKGAADMTLTDDNFASIVGAVEEGRAIFTNIKKYLMYLLSANIGEIGLLAGATLAGLPLPLTAVQILYVNLATDGLPALALAVDPQEHDLMQRRPRDPQVGIFSRPVLLLMLTGGIWSTIVNLSLFTWALESGRQLQHAMTMTFVALVLIEFLKAYNFRSDRHTLFRHPFANKWLNLSILWESTLLLLIVYTPFLQIPFTTYGLGVEDWALIVAAAFTIIPVLEGAKWVVRKNLVGRLD